MGSSNYITNLDGNINQHMEYLPFGETLVEEHLNSYNSPYKFNAKEFDAETGWYYYGARYYNPKWSLMLSVDRFAEKYPGLSPYSYAAQNPLKYVDINGDSLWIAHKGNRYLYENGNLFNEDGSAFEGKQRGFLKRTTNALNSIGGTKEGGALLSELQGSDNSFTIMKGRKSEFKSSNAYKAFANQWATDPKQAKTYAMLQKSGMDFSGGSGGTIYWDKSGSPLITLTGVGKSPITDLAHELFHGLDANRGLLDDRMYNGLQRKEWQATYRENVLRGQLGLPYRSHYRSSLNAATGARAGLPPRMLSPAPANTPILPFWYTK